MRFPQIIKFPKGCLLAFLVFLFITSFVIVNTTSASKDNSNFEDLFLKKLSEIFDPKTWVWVTSDLTVELCKEEDRIMNEWGRQAALAGGVSPCIVSQTGVEEKYVDCLNKCVKLKEYPNPRYKYDPFDDLAKADFFTRNTDTANISDYMSRIGLSYNWGVWKIVHSITDICGEPYSITLIFCRDVGPGESIVQERDYDKLRELTRHECGFTVDIHTLEVCADTKLYHNYGTHIVIQAWKSFFSEELIPHGTPQEKPEVPEECTLPPETETERQEIIKRVKETYGFEIVDSIFCGQETCGDNSLWNVGELLNVEKAFSTLPSCFTKNLNLSQIKGLDQEGCCKKEGDKFTDQEEAIAFYWYWWEGGKIVFCKRGGDVGALVHELTHALQYQGYEDPYANPIVIDWINETGWSCLPFLGCSGELVVPSDVVYYGGTNPIEDMAESVRLYVFQPKALLGISERRYNFVRDKIMCGVEFAPEKCLIRDGETICGEEQITKCFDIDGKETCAIPADAFPCVDTSERKRACFENP